jgi:putative ABC transport system permease protein
MMDLRLAWRLLAGRPGLAWLALVCVAVGISARGAVSGTVSAMEDHLAGQARAVLAADLEVSSSRPLEAAVREAVQAALPPGARTAELRTMTAMAVGGGTACLVELRAVGPGWPLAGELRGDPADSAARLRLTPPEVLVDPDLLPRLGVAVGDTLGLGSGSFRIAGTISAEPGAGGNAFRLGPRLYADLAALESAGLVGAGVRARHSLLITISDPSAASNLADALRRSLGLPTDQAEGMGSGPSQAPVTVRSASEAAQQGARGLARASDLLRVIAMFALALGALGVAALARGMMRAQAEDLAVLRVLGAGGRRAAGVFAVQAVAVGVAGGLAGTAIGAALAAIATSLFGIPPALPRLVDVTVGLGLGVVAALAAATLPALTLARMAPLAVLRGEAPSAHPPAVAAMLWSVVIVLAMLAAAWESRSWTLGPGIVLAAVVIATALALAGRILLPLLGRLRPAGFALRHACANLGRAERAPAGLVVALGLAAALGGALLVLQATFAAELAPGRLAAKPAFFAIDIQDDQRESLTAALRQRGLEPNLRPQIRARLRSLDGTAASAAPAAGTREEERAAHFRRREQNLTWATAPGPGERLVAGNWPVNADECAVETRWAERLGVGLGSRLVFDVQGVEVAVTVSGLRAIDWWTFQPNFFVVLHPDALPGAPAVWLGTIPTMEREARRTLAAELARSHPNISLIDVAEAASTVRTAIDRAATAIAAIAAVALLAGLAVVAGTAAAGARERRAEAALIRALGGTRRTVAMTLACEFALLAGLATVLGAAGGAAGGALLTAHLLDAAATWPWLAMAALMVVLTTAATAVALLTARTTWTVPPLAALREE